MGRLDPKHWAILVAGLLTALGSMIGAADHWADVLKPQAVAPFIGQLAVLVAAIFAGAPQNPNLGPFENPGRRGTDVGPVSDIGTVSDATRRTL